MDQTVVNLKFLNTLMTDKSTTEKWETFINAKGPQLEQMSTQQLYAEVRVNAANAKPAEASSSSSNEVRVLTTTEIKQAIKRSRHELTVPNATMAVAEMDKVAPRDQDFLIVPTNIAKSMAIEDTTQKSV